MACHSPLMALLIENDPSIPKLIAANGQLLPAAESPLSCALVNANPLLWWLLDLDRTVRRCDRPKACVRLSKTPQYCRRYVLPVVPSRAQSRFQLKLWSTWGRRLARALLADSSWPVVVTGWLRPGLRSRRLEYSDCR